MDGWTWALWIAAGYVAVVSLARLMVARRNRLVDEFRRQLTVEKRKRAKQPQEKKPSAQADDAA